MTRDLRTLIYLLNLELREECSRTLGWNLAGAASGCGEQQSKWTQSGSMQQLKRMRSGAAAEADASGEHAAAAEGGRNRGLRQQLEADANGKHNCPGLPSSVLRCPTDPGTSRDILECPKLPTDPFIPWDIPGYPVEMSY